MVSDYINTQDKKKICVLTADGVQHLHELLSTHYKLLEDMDPVQPPGVKNRGLLDSAVYRQHTGSGEWYKYSDYFDNCATLTYGVIKNHAFHNGNKRTGLLAMIKHLYINGYVLNPRIKSNEIYDFILSIASNTLPMFSKKFYNTYNKKSNTKITRTTFWSPDEEIEFMAKWLRKNTCPKSRELKSSVKLNKLKKILERKGLKIKQTGTKIKIYKEVNIGLIGLITGKKIHKNEREYSIGRNLVAVPIKVLKNIRKDYDLTRNNGIDNVMFYDDSHFIEEEMRVYKKIIYRLSKT